MKFRIKAADAQKVEFALPNKRYLVVNLSSGNIQEVDQAGKVHWTHQHKGASYATRLPGGNTLICDHSNKKIVEITPAGKSVWEQSLGSQPWRVHRR